MHARSILGHIASPHWTLKIAYCSGFLGLNHGGSSPESRCPMTMWTVTHPIELPGRTWRPDARHSGRARQISHRRPARPGPTWHSERDQRGCEWVRTVGERLEGDRRGRGGEGSPMRGTTYNNCSACRGACDWTVPSSRRPVEPARLASDARI